MRPMLMPGKVYHRHKRCPMSNRRRRAKTRTGSQIPEFAAALMLLFGVALAPLLDLAVVPIRWMLAQEIVNSYVRMLAICESYSESCRAIDADPSMQTQLLRLGGVSVKHIDLNLKITRVPHGQSVPEFIEVHLPGCIPNAWLPNGTFAPCVYMLNINVEASVAPAVLMNWQSKRIPGLTEPIPVILTASHEWANLGRDPATEKYFINE